MLSSVLPVFVMLALGVLCRRKQLITPEGVEGLQSLALKITLPASLFSTFYKADIAGSVVLFPLTYVSAMAIGLAVGAVLLKVMKRQDAYFPFMLTSYEGGLIGYALMTQLMGSEGMARFALMDLGVGISTYTFYAVLIGKVTGGKKTPKEMITEMVKTPILVAEVVGLLLAVTGLGHVIENSPAGPVIDSVCSFLGAPTSAAILLSIGYRIQFKGIHAEKIVSGLLTRFVFQILLCGVILAIYHLLGGVFTEKTTTVAVILSAVLPPTYVLPIYVKEEEKKAFYSSIVTVYTVLTMGCFALISFLIA